MSKPLAHAIWEYMAHINAPLYASDIAAAVGAAEHRVRAALTDLCTQNRAAKEKGERNSRGGRLNLWTIPPGTTPPKPKVMGISSMVIAALEGGNAMTRLELADLTSASEYGLKWVLRSLLERGVLSRIGRAYFLASEREQVNPETIEVQPNGVIVVSKGNSRVVYLTNTKHVHSDTIGCRHESGISSSMDGEYRLITG